MIFTKFSPTDKSWIFFFTGGHKTREEDQEAGVDNQTVLKMGDVGLFQTFYASVREHRSYGPTPNRIWKEPKTQLWASGPPPPRGCLHITVRVCVCVCHLGWAESCIFSITLIKSMLNTPPSTVPVRPQCVCLYVCVSPKRHSIIRYLIS